MLRLKLNADTIFRVTQIEQGIFIQHDMSLVSFSHLTIQEFLTAKFIDRSQAGFEKIVAKYLFDERWKDVFRLLSEMGNRKRFFTTAFQAFFNKALNNSTITELLPWINGFVVKTKTTAFLLALAFALEMKGASLESIKHYSNNIGATNVYL